MTRSSGSIRYPALVAVLAAAALLAAGCSDPPADDAAGAPSVTQPRAETEPGDDPALGIERFLAELAERTGYTQSGHLETDDGTTRLWVHVDPDHDQWVADTLAARPLEGVEVIAAQPVGANGSLVADARRFSTEEVRGYVEAVTDLAGRLAAELAAGDADDPDSYPTTAATEVEYGRAGELLTVRVVARFDRLPASAVAELRELVPAEVLDLQLDARD